MKRKRNPETLGPYESLSDDPFKARRILMQEYDVEVGRNSTRIVGPGQFEGEQIYVPYYYDIYMNGFEDYRYGEREWI